MENAQSEDEVLENGTDMHMIDLQSELHFGFKRTFVSCMWVRECVCAMNT